MLESLDLTLVAVELFACLAFVPWEFVLCAGREGAGVTNHLGISGVGVELTGWSETHDNVRVRDKEDVGIIVYLHLSLGTQRPTCISLLPN